MAGEGLDEINTMRLGGVPELEISKWQQEQNQKLIDAGTPQNVIDDYFGHKEPDTGKVNAHITENIISSANKNLPEGQTPRQAKTLSEAFGLMDLTKAPDDGTKPGEVKHAEGFIDAFEAGFQTSVTGLLKRGKLPTTVLPEHAPMYMRIASQVGTLAGDLPEMVVGGVGGAAAGGAVGSAVPVVGNIAGAAVGAGAGSFALPQGMRKVLMDHYEKGDIKDFGDFWSRAAGAFIEAGKGAVIGGVTSGVGGLAAKTVGSAAAPVIKTTAQLSSEVATMTTVGAALEGHAPDAQDFLDGAILVGGLHGATHVAGKARQLYAEKGIPPGEAALQSVNDVQMKQALIVEGGEITLPKEEAPSVAPKLPEGAVAPELTSQEKVLSRIGIAEDAAKKPYTKENFYKDYVDKLDPINEAIKQLGADTKALQTSENPYKLSRMVGDSKAKVKYIFEHGMLDYATNEKVGKSFAEIISPVKNDMNGLRAYMISDRAIEVSKREIQTGVDLEAAKKVVAEGKAKFAGPAKELVDFQNGIAKYLKDSGAISENTFNNIVEAGKSYIPLTRITEEGSAVGGGTSKKPLSKLKGSELKIQDPFLSMVDKAELFTRVAERNRAVLSLVDLAEKTPDQTIMSKVPASTRKIDISVEEFSKTLKEQGIDVKDAEGFSVFRGQSKDLLENQFEVYREGKREVWETADPELAKAIKAVDGNKPIQNIMLRMARGLTNVKRLMISITPEFQIKNMIRDQVTATTFSTGKMFPVVDTIAAMGDFMKESKAYGDWLKSGGASGAFMELGENYLNNNLLKLNKEAGNFIEAGWNRVTTAGHYLKVAGELAEQSTRLAEFKRIYEAKGGKGLEASLSGGFGAREVTVDFQRMGAKMAAFNAITAFQNVGIQGLDRSIRAIKDNPTKTVSTAAAIITAPSVLLWWANHDDERYKELPRYVKDLHWIIITDNWRDEEQPGEAGSFPDYLTRQVNGKTQINKGNIYRIPKPQELGLLFGSLPERVLDMWVDQNPNAMKDFGSTVADLVAPSFVPDAVSPLFEQYANKSFFTGNKVVPSYLEGIAPEYQYTDYTSETAQQLGKLISKVPGLRDIGSKNVTLASPIVIENYIRSWGGSVGSYTLQLADKALIASGMVPDPVKPADTLADMPFVKAFVIRNPSAGAQSIRDFYENFEKAKVSVDTRAHLMAQMEFPAVELETNKAVEEGTLSDLQGMKDSLSKMSRTARSIYRNADIPANEKRQLIDSVYYQMIDLSRQGNAVFRDMKKMGSEQAQ